MTMSLDGIAVNAAMPCLRPAALRRGIPLYAQLQLAETLHRQTNAAFQAWLAEACEDAGIPLPNEGEQVNIDWRTGELRTAQGGPPAQS